MKTSASKKIFHVNMTIFLITRGNKAKYPVDTYLGSNTYGNKQHTIHI